MEIITVENLLKSFDGLGGVLKGISFTLNEGEVLSIIGPSGSGKSTLLRCLTQLEPVDGGGQSMCVERPWSHQARKELLPTQTSKHLGL